jgi:histidine ammonia-lyase
MGSITAYHALQIADNTSRIIASELFAAFQGVSVRLQQLGKSCDDFSILGAGTAAIMQTLREAGIRPYATDEWFYEPLNVISELLRGEKLLNAVDAALKG